MAGAKQIVLVVDIAVERGFADAEALGNIFERGPVAAAAIEHPRRLTNDGLALGIRLLGAAWHRVGPTSHSHLPVPSNFWRGAFFSKMAQRKRKCKSVNLSYHMVTSSASSAAALNAMSTSCSSGKRRQRCRSRLRTKFALIVNIKTARAPGLTDDPHADR